MKNLKRSFLALLLILTLIVSSIVPVSAATTSSGSQPAQYSSQYNSGTRDVVCTTLDGTSADDYYTNSYAYDKLDDLSSSALLTTLRTLMTNTHTYKTTYNECHTLANRSDCEEGNGKGNTSSEQKVLLLYTSYTSNQSEWNGWNREHVWPKSLGGNNDSDRGGGADLHHIRPSDAGVNSSRGNKKYGEAGANATEKYGTKPAVGVLGGTYNSTYFEPLDNVKGDVARICLYVWVRWGSDWGANNITQVFQSVDVLLEWCALDPVDTWEMGRNEVIEDIQGNRNVFIDYPELAWLLFDREIPSDMVTPSGEAAKGTGGSGSGSGSTTPSVCQHTTTELRGVIAVSCTVNGYTGDTYCKTCNTKISDGQSIPATGHNNTVTQNKVTATCGQEGYTGDTYCNDCKTIVAYGESIPTTSHMWRQTVADGVTTRTCVNCGEVEIRGGENCTHSGTRVVNKVNATCSTEGYTGDKVCGYCGVTVSYGTSIPTTAHTWGDWVDTSEDEQTRACTKCDATETRESVCEHTETVMSGYIEASCTYEGYTGDVHCFYCYELIEAGHATPMIAHEWSDWTDNGDGFETRACGSCGETESREATEIPCPHNDTVRVDKVDATCDTAGYTGDWYCNDCGEVTGIGSVIPAHGHVWGAPEITKEPTATEDGEQSETCQNCGEVVTTVIPATGEDITDDPIEPEVNDANVIVNILVAHLLETILWNLLA